MNQSFPHSATNRSGGGAAQTLAQDGEHRLLTTQFQVANVVDFKIGDVEFRFRGDSKDSRARTDQHGFDQSGMRSLGCGFERGGLAGKDHSRDYRIEPRQRSRSSS